MSESAVIDKLTKLILKHLEAADALELLPDLANRLKLEAAQRLLKTRVISAVELTGSQKTELLKGLSIDEADWVIDADILGGLIVEHEGKRTDLSWRQRLVS